MIFSIEYSIEYSTGCPKIIRLFLIVQNQKFMCNITKIVSSTSQKWSKSTKISQKFLSPNYFDSAVPHLILQVFQTLFASWLADPHNIKCERIVLLSYMDFFDMRSIIGENLDLGYLWYQSSADLFVYWAVITKDTPFDCSRSADHDARRISMDVAMDYQW